LANNSEERGGGCRWDLAMSLPNLDSVQDLLWPEGFRRDVWMILDGARDPRIFGMLANSYLKYSCLYSGQIPSALKLAAPYLVPLQYDDRYTWRFIRNAWGNSWGVFIRCDSAADTLCRHLRQFLLVRVPGGSRLVFRFYDPRVLRVYLPSCNEAELRTVFGPISDFYVEDENPGNIWDFHLEGTRLVQQKISVQATRPTAG
jgi:Domain of unknown function (DUF4123)